MRKLVIVLILLAMCVPLMAQEEGSTLYTTDHYQIPVPAGWQNNSTTEMGHFTNADGTANLYTLSTEADDVQIVIMDALVQIDSDFAAQPVQTMDVPLPGGVVWTQNVYALPDGDIIAVLGRVSGEWAYVIVFRAPQSVLAAESATLNQVLLGHTIIGEESITTSLPNYINPDAFTESETVVVNGEYELPATLALPVGDGRFPAVVIVHGSGPNDRDGTLAFNKPYRDITQGLASQGIAVLRYDKRTFVYREPVAGFTVDHEVTDDALAAVQLLRNMEAIDPERIYVLGHSQGAMFAPRIAEQNGDLAGIILMAGTPYTFDQVLSTQVGYLQSLDPDADVAGLDGLIVILEAIRNGADPVAAFGGDENQAMYWESMMAYVPGDTASSLSLPMLIVQGERDYQTTMTDFEAWQSVLGDRDNVTFISYPTLNHIFMPLGDLERMAIAADYSESGFVDAAVITDIANWING